MFFKLILYPQRLKNYSTPKLPLEVNHLEIIWRRAYLDAIQQKWKFAGTHDIPGAFRIFSREAQSAGNIKDSGN
jgi:hypothetical protein